jgi:hypothetical protein
MNKRIRELAERAGAEFEKTNGLNDCSQDSLVGDEIEAFAELIVRECADLFEFVYGNSGVSGHEVARVLKKHFGVEL